MTEKRNKEIIAYIQTLPSEVFIDNLEIMPEGHITISFTEDFRKLDSNFRDYIIEDIGNNIHKKFGSVLNGIGIWEWFDGNNYVHLGIEYTDRAELAVYIRKNIDLFKSGRTDEFLTVAKKELSSSSDFTTLVTMLQDAGLEPRY